MVGARWLTVLGLLAATSAPPSLARAEDGRDEHPDAAPCIECIHIRVGLPRVVRGPAPNIADNPFSEIKLDDDRFRGFTASATTFAIDGNQPWDMGGPAVAVLKPGPPNSPSSCGQWLQHAEPAGKMLFAWIHDETACNYKNGYQTHKSMSLATSADHGLTWHVEGSIISGTDAPTPGRITGEGDCTAVDGRDGYYYAYCWRNTNPGVIVARAPVTNPGPGNWRKYFNGAWSEPGLGGNASKLASGAGTATSHWLSTGETVNLGRAPGGLGLFFSRDHVTFTALPEPLFVQDKNLAWNRPDPRELLWYWSLLDAKTGANQLADHWNLFYMDVQPNEGSDKRYLVFRPVEVSRRSHEPGKPQVAVVLGRWHNAAHHDRWSTTAAVPGNYTTYLLEKETGYLMTASDPAKPSVELEDCVSQSPGHPDHILEQVGVCEPAHYQRLRTAGWIYSKQQEHTVPLYRCYNPQDQSHFASNEADCEKLGTMERLLGYALAQ